MFWHPLISTDINLAPFVFHHQGDRRTEQQHHMKGFCTKTKITAFSIHFCSLHVTWMIFVCFYKIPQYQKIWLVIQQRQRNALISILRCTDLLLYIYGHWFACKRWHRGGIFLVELRHHLCDLEKESLKSYFQWIIHPLSDFACHKSSLGSS